MIAVNSVDGGNELGTDGGQGVGAGEAVSLDVFDGVEVEQEDAGFLVTVAGAVDAGQGKVGGVQEAVELESGIVRGGLAGLRVPT